MKVYVYFNLHKRKFSVKAMEGENKGRVVAHVDSIHLLDAVFKVSQAGRARVLREQKKYVHAGVIGYWTEDIEADRAMAAATDCITYNPYKYDSFVNKSDDFAPVSKAAYAYLHDRQINASFAQ